MSLLIDALKQAEAARAQAQGGEPTAGQSGLELEPLPGTSDVAPPHTPERASSTAPARSPSPRRGRVAVHAPGLHENEAARELFEVKRQPRNQLPLILAGVGIFVLLAGAGYVWWAMQPRSSLLAAGASTSGSLPQASTVPQEPAAASAQHDAQPAAISEASPPAESSKERADASSNARVVSRTEARPAPARRRETQRSEVPAGAAPSLGDGSRPSIIAGNPAQDSGGVQAAYAAFLEGNYTLARQRYQEVLKQDPRNLDAMNALGLIAWRSGQPDAAERMFRAALHADPKDATASAQLAMLYSESDASSAESRLRNLIASQPAMPAPYFALGSLLSRQGRWNEAQQALFQAYTLDSDNPDILFNLAISLEHLSQPAVACQFYERALQASKRRPASFDRNVATSRVQQLESR